MNNRTIVNLLEILFITALIMLFGMTTYTLVAVGGDSYSRILEKRDQNSEARVALSYMTTRIRQADRSGGVSIKGYENMQVLTILQSVDGELYENRVYCLDGLLLEALVPASDSFDPLAGEPIAALDRLQLSFVGGQDGSTTAIRLAVWPIAENGGMSVPVETTLSLQAS